MATLAFLSCFWAWALLSPVAPEYQARLSLSPPATALLTAVPVLVGSLGRIPVGALADRYGGHRVMAGVCWISVPPVALLAFVDGPLLAVLGGGLLLGVAGTAFAAGMPHLYAWYPPHRRGTALGLFGLGTAGTAVATAVTPWLVDTAGRTAAFLLPAALLLLVGACCLKIMSPAPGHEPTASGTAPRLRDTARLPTTVRLSLLYAVSYGGYGGLALYLPVLLTDADRMPPAAATTTAALFTVAAVLARVLGGRLADRIGAVRLLHLALPGAAATVTVAATGTGPTVVAATLVLAGALMGAAAGAVYQLVATLAPPGRSGAVGGIVGAVGGLGSFALPLLLGTVRHATDTFVPGILLLAAALVAALATARSLRHPPPPTPHGPNHEHPRPATEHAQTHP
ncbi:MFS transporter (plasmid) [Streptomyces sp. BI20]|uniref:MFS transporter n=1 Tax=Streptomyces sp. BI20 TaxID=3403460 RepID=UPI003C735D71